MDELVLNSFESKLRRLPPKVKAVLVALETGDAIYAVSEKHAVETRVSSYSGLVAMVLMGELSPNLLVKNIVEKENIDTEKAKLIAMDLSAAIFQPIKQELVIMYGLTPKAPAPSVAPPAPENRSETIDQPAPSTREPGLSLPELPASNLPPTPPLSSSPNPSTSEDKNFYSPSPTLTPQNDGALSPSGNSKPNIIDLSKEPPRPVAQPGDPPLEGNIVNLKQINNQ